MHSKNVVTSLVFPEPKWLSNTKNSKCSREKEKDRGDKYVQKKKKKALVLHALCIYANP